MRSLVIFEHTVRFEVHGKLGLGVLPTASRCTPVGLGFKGDVLGCGSLNRYTIYRNI